MSCLCGNEKIESEKYNYFGNFLDLYQFTSNKHISMMLQISQDLFYFCDQA